MKDIKTRKRHHDHDDGHKRQHSHKMNTKSADTQAASKKVLKVTGAALLAIGGAVLASQSAQALSPLTLVNGITSGGGVGSAKTSCTAISPYRI